MSDAAALGGCPRRAGEEPRQRSHLAKKLLLKRSSASGGPGTIKVTRKLTRAAKRKLERKGKLKVRTSISFTPTGGASASTTKRLKLKS